MKNEWLDNGLTMIFENSEGIAQWRFHKADVNLDSYLNTRDVFVVSPRSDFFGYPTYRMFRIEKAHSTKKDQKKFRDAGSTDDELVKIMARVAQKKLTK